MMRIIRSTFKSGRRVTALALAFLLLTACAAPAAEFTGIVEPQDNYRTFYEIYVGAFYDSDGDKMGDLNGVTKKLDYINDNRADSTTSLHATGIWLMPIFPSPTYHKYDTTDYYSIDPEFGTLDDFDALAAECDTRGISLILDLVVNHTSNDHPWFRSACASIGVEPCGANVCTVQNLCREHNPYCDWFVFSQEAHADYYVVPGGNGWYYEARFWSGMPDLNLDSADLRAEILKIGEYWLERGADGFRLDAVTSFYTGNTAKNAEFLSFLHDGLRELRDDVYLVGEAWTDAGTIHNLSASGVPGMFNFQFAESTGDIISNVRSGSGEKLATAIERWHTQLAQANANAIDAPFLTNHDMTRSSGALMAKTELQKQAAALYLLLPGSPFIYYGEEIAMAGGGKNDESKRTPMVWSNDDATGMPNPPKDAEVRDIEAGVDKQLKDKNSLLRFYIDTIRVRNKYPSIARGTFAAYAAGDSAVCAYTVEWEGETLLIAHNLSEETVSITIPDGFAVLETLSALPKSKAPTTSGTTLTLPPRTVAIAG